jgi:crossover junction endodeoxyribonuclease RuvC
VGDPVTRQLGERMRVLGIDPGLTRCGLGVVDGVPGRQPLVVAVDVVRTPSDLDTARRLLAIDEAVDSWITRYRPTAVAIKRVFAQHNVQTVMGTAQAAGVERVARTGSGARTRGKPHNPSPLRKERPAPQCCQRSRESRIGDHPADAADALALAICHVWRGSTTARLNAAVEAAGNHADRQRSTFGKSSQPRRRRHE